MNRVLKTTRLHLNKRANFFGVPPQIVAVVWLVSVIIALAIQRAGADPSAPNYIDGARTNMGVFWSMSGFFIYYGVQAVATTYPFGLAVGTTRRNFIIGTMLANALQAAYVAIMLVALLGLELATDHWFASIYVFDVFTLGAGNFGVLAATGFIWVLFCLTIGGFFGAVWVRFGAKGPSVVGIALALILAITILIVAPNLGAIVRGITFAGIASALVVLTAAALLGTWLAMRRASVR